MSLILILITILLMAVFLMKKTDNLIAFGWYEDELHEVGKYYKVVKHV